MLSKEELIGLGKREEEKRREWEGVRGKRLDKADKKTGYEVEGVRIVENRVGKKFREFKGKWYPIGLEVKVIRCLAEGVEEGRRVRLFWGSKRGKRVWGSLVGELEKLGGRRGRGNKEVGISVGRRVVVLDSCVGRIEWEDGGVVWKGWAEDGQEEV